jgi:hypothetical protein
MAIHQVPDYTVGFTEAEVLDILAIQKAELKKTMQQWQESGSQVLKRRLDETNAIITACQRALRKLDPEQYGRNHRVGQSRIEPFFTK